MKLRSRKRINSFHDFISNCKQFEVPFKGQLYTRFNRRECGLIKERLDMA